MPTALGWGELLIQATKAHHYQWCALAKAVVGKKISRAQAHAD